MSSEDECKNGVHCPPPSKGKKNGGSYVTVVQCQTTHGDVTRQMSDVQSSVDKIVNTLLGEPKRGSLERSQGLVDYVKDIKAGMKSRWSPKEKAAIIISMVTAISAIIVAVFT